MKSTNYLLILLSLTLTGMPASNACEYRDKPSQIGKEWKHKSYKVSAIVNNQKEVKCDRLIIGDEYGRETYKTVYKCGQFAIINEQDGFLLKAQKIRWKKNIFDVWVLVDKNKKSFYLNAEKINCDECKDTGTDEMRKTTFYCNQNLQEDYTKIQLKSEIENVLIDKERPQL